MLDILGSMKDAGLKLLYAIMVVLPGVLEEQGQKINALSALLDESTDINNIIAQLQELFNEAKNTDIQPIPQDFYRKVEDLYSKLAGMIALMKYQAASGVFPDSLVDSMAEAWNNLNPDNVDPRTVGESWILLWKQAVIDDPDSPADNLKVKGVLDAFNTMKTGMTGYSSGVQTELKMETESINQIMAAIKDIGQNFNQMEKSANQKPPG
jgi:methyl-accepting chemotaxis protein